EDVLLGDQVSTTARFSIIDTFNVTDEQSITSHVTSHDSINFTDSIAPPRVSVSVAEFIDFEETIEINVHALVIETVTVSDNSFAETHIVISDYFQEVLPNPAIVGQ